MKDGKIENIDVLQTNIEGWERMFKAFKERGGGIRNYPIETVVSWVKSFATVDSPIKRVLDLGCGGSPNLFFFLENGFEYYGIDVTDEAFKDLNGLDSEIKQKAHLSTFDPPFIPFDDNYFTHIVSTEALHLNADDSSMKTAISECLRVLTPGGRLLATTITPEHWFIKNGEADWISDSVIKVNTACQDPSRTGIYYYIFKDDRHIKEYFNAFSSCVAGKEQWYFGEQPDREVSHYIISVTK